MEFLERSNVIPLNRPAPPLRRADPTRAADSFRLLFVTETWPPEENGVADAGVHLVEGLRARGHQVHVVRPAQGWHDTLRDHPGQSLVRSLRMPFRRERRIGLPVADHLSRLVENLQPDAVHVATEGPLGWMAVSAAKRAGIPVSADLHANIHLYNHHYTMEMMSSLVLAYLRAFHNRADSTTVPTKKLARALLDRGVDHLFVVGRGVDADLFNPARRSHALRREWGARVYVPVVLYVGHLSPGKNLRLVFRAFEAICRWAPGARLVLVGDGPLRRAIERSKPQTVILDPRHGEALADCYAAADILLFPSLTETYGNVTLEALASGLAVVAFDYAAAGELIEDGVSGCLAPYADEAAFVDRAQRLMHDPGHTARLRVAARQLAERHPWNGIIGQFESYLQHALIEPARDDASAKADRDGHFIEPTTRVGI